MHPIFGKRKRMQSWYFGQLADQNSYKIKRAAVLGGGGYSFKHTLGQLCVVHELEKKTPIFHQEKLLQQYNKISVNIHV